VSSGTPPLNGCRCFACDSPSRLLAGGQACRGVAAAPCCALLRNSRRTPGHAPAPSRPAPLHPTPPTHPLPHQRAAAAGKPCQRRRQRRSAVGGWRPGRVPQLAERLPFRRGEDAAAGGSGGAVALRRQGAAAAASMLHARAGPQLMLAPAACGTADPLCLPCAADVACAVTGQSSTGRS
jgi:hypothetical protein